MGTSTTQKVNRLSADAGLGSSDGERRTSQRRDVRSESTTSWDSLRSSAPQTEIPMTGTI